MSNICYYFWSVKYWENYHFAWFDLWREEDSLIKIQALFVPMNFHTKINSIVWLLITAVIIHWYLHLNSTMILPVVATMDYTKEKKRVNMNIGVGSIMNSEVRYMRYIKRDRRITSMSKYVVVCLQDVVEKKKFLVIFEYGKKIEMSDSWLSYLC